MSSSEILSVLDKPYEGLAIVPLNRVAQIAVSSRKNFDLDQVLQYIQASDIDPNYFLFYFIEKIIDMFISPKPESRFPA